MASAISRTGALDLLEDSVHTLRQTPLATLLCHWTGSAPFAMALALFSVDCTLRGATGSRSVVEALVLALLWVWMNCWRAVFAGRLRRRLSGAADSPWTARRVWRLLAAQSFLGGARMLVLPLSAVTIFPFAVTVAFFRHAAVLADREDLELPDLISKARRLAAIDQAQSWLLLLMLVFLWLVSFLNIVVTLALLPQLIRIFTGYESAFSRAGINLLASSLFWLSAILTTWLIFDPLAQAAWCVRCFRGESLETGEDLRAMLRSIRKVLQPAALMLALVIPAAITRADIAPGDLDRSIRQTLQSHQYDWRLAPPETRPSTSPSWIVTVAERLVSAGKSILRALGRFVKWLFDWLKGQLGPLGDARPLPGAALSGGIYLLIAALALTLVIAWWLQRAKAKAMPAEAARAVSLYDENLVADRLPEDAWLAMADERLAAGDFRAALRALYLANLAWLGARAWIAIHAGKTNREYEIELRRKSRALPELSQWFARNVVSFERAWYGLHEVSAEDTRLFRENIGRMKVIAAPAEAAA